MDSIFETSVCRGPTYAYKWEKYSGKDILPVWVADAEYPCPKPIIDGLKKYLDNQILGYTLPSQYTPANDAVVSWLQQQYGWKIDPAWIVWTPGVVPAFNVACKAYAPRGSKVIVQVPNYPPLLSAPGINELERLDVPTVTSDGRDTLDFEILEAHAKDPLCHLMILCNPMNPNGSVLTESELERIADICRNYNVTLCSDEIHCDLILDESQKHIPAGKVKGMSSQSITLMAASKTFNVAGLGTSFAIIPSATMRQAFTKAASGIVPWVNILGLVATEIAFTQCHQWYQDLIVHLRTNRDYLAYQLASVEGLNYTPSAATFLAWVDVKALNYSNPQKWFEQRGVGPSPGRDFGSPDHIRINFASSNEYLQRVVARIKAPLKE